MKCKHAHCPNDAVLPKYQGYCDNWCFSLWQEYQRGREEERRDVVAWLRDGVWEPARDVLDAVIDKIQIGLSTKIENGEHEVKR